MCVNFAYQNDDRVTLTLHPFSYEAETYKFMLVVGFFVIGVIFGVISSSLASFSLKMQNKSLRRRERKLESEITQLKDSLGKSNSSGTVDSSSMPPI
jgi:uncharacterized membrane protein YciS (DUF1049 family)